MSRVITKISGGGNLKGLKEINSNEFKKKRFLNFTKFENPFYQFTVFICVYRAPELYNINIDAHALYYTTFFVLPLS